jgi:IS30 family transposase
MTCYRRVAISDRYQIKAYLETKVGPVEIARKLGFHKSTIYREIRRNSVDHGYVPDPAHALAKARFACCCRKPRLTSALREFVTEKVGIGWAPEQISGRLRLERDLSLSHETIYKFMRGQLATGASIPEGLRRSNKKGGRRTGRGKILKADWMKSIHDRPQIIEERKRLGDWERDGMFGRNKQQVLVCVDRKARYTKMVKVIDPYCLHITKQSEELLKSTGKLRSITNDNGNEFLDGNYFKVPVYYCDPRKPQQRGTVENTIGLVRQYLPKKVDLEAVSDAQIQEIEDKLNYRPRKCLDYKTPYEVFFNKRVALVS